MTLLVLGILLAGCTDPPPTQARSDALTINVTGDGPFRVAVPLPVDSIWTVPDWQAVAGEKAVSIGNATVATGPTDRGPALWIDGSGFVSIELFRDLHPGCCADSFVEGTWSTHDAPRPIAALAVHVADGSISLLRIQHEASSCQGTDCRQTDASINQYCSLSFAARGGPLAGGWNELEVREDDWRCTPAP